MITHVKIPILGEFQKVIFIRQNTKTLQAYTTAHWVKVYRKPFWGKYFHFGKPRGMYILDYGANNLHKELKANIRNIPTFKEGEVFPIAVAH